MKSLVESILDTTNNSLDSDSKWMQLTGSEEIEGFAQYLKDHNLDWEIDNSKTMLGSDHGRTVVVHLSRQVNLIMDFLYKDCTEFLYRLEDAKTNEELDSCWATYTTWRVHWDEFMDFKGDFKKRIQRKNRQMKKAVGVSDRETYKRAIDKYKNIIKML